MPRIVLKPNSPEYIAEEKGPPPRRCDMAGCRHAAAHKAPKTRDLTEHYWFCVFHAKAYNEAWDYFAGLSAREVAEHLARVHEGGGEWGHQHGNAEALRAAAQKARAFHESERTQTRRPMPAADTPEGAALALMNLRPPLDLAKIKARYRELAKKYHPDRNGGCRVAEEHLKHINMAYTVLKAAWGRWEATQKETV